MALNRAIARGFAEGADAGLAGLNALAASGKLDGYHLLPAAQAEFLARRGDATAAVERYQEAIALAPTGPEQRHLEQKLAALSGH